MTEKKELTNLTKEELVAEIAGLGEKSFRAKQLWQWIYFRGVTDFAEMSNLSLSLRQKLEENYTITRPKIITEQISVDKTHKWLLEFKDGERVEMVYIPEKDRGAVCISTQVGCAMGVSILPHRKPEIYPEFDCRRNCRTIYGGSRCVWRMAEPDR